MDITNAFRKMDLMIADAKPTNLFENVRRKAETERPLIDDYALRQGQAWSVLSEQVVGAEY